MTNSTTECIPTVFESVGEDLVVSASIAGLTNGSFVSEKAEVLIA